MLYFIVNESASSGKGAIVWRKIKEELCRRKTEYQVWMTEYVGHTGVLAKNICERKEEDICLVVVGGDGTINEAINGISHFERVRFGVIPVGSGNDFARGLKLSKDPTENLEQILAQMQLQPQSAKRMDLGQVSWNGGAAPRLFAVSAGVGLDALVCKKALQSKLKKALNKIHLGKLTYLCLTVQSLFSMETSDAGIRFERTNSKNRPKTIFIAAMNFRAEGGGVPMAPLASAFDGKLSVCQTWGIPKWRTFLCLPFLVAAKHVHIKGFNVTDCQTCDVKLRRPMVLHADGEYCGDVTEIQFKCIPEKIKILNSGTE